MWKLLLCINSIRCMARNRCVFFFGPLTGLIARLLTGLIVRLLTGLIVRLLTSVIVHLLTGVIVHLLTGLHCPPLNRSYRPPLNKHHCPPLNWSNRPPLNRLHYTLLQMPYQHRTNATGRYIASSFQMVILCDFKIQYITLITNTHIINRQI